MENIPQEAKTLIADLFDAAESGYGWICNFPTSDPGLEAAQRKVSKEVGDLLYSDPRLEPLRAARRERLKAEQE
jgi:hypothetical protein